MKIRIQKYLANNSGYSRRQIEEMIKQNKIKINDILAKPGDTVSKEDEILINNKKISKISEKIYLLLNKPAGYTCTRKTFNNEDNIYTLLPPKYSILKPVGRLDKDSEGLLILTNDGDYIHKQTHPKFKTEKEYTVTVNRDIDQKILNRLKEGVDIGVDSEKEVVKCTKIKKISDIKFSIIITQGKNRQIRRMCGAVGLRVIRLQRIREGKINLNDLNGEDYKEINI